MYSTGHTYSIILHTRDSESITDYNIPDIFLSLKSFCNILQTNRQEISWNEFILIKPVVSGSVYK